MCGIIGIIDLSGVSKKDEAMVRQGLALLKHRGPDEEGVFKDNQAVLGHVRLSIIDLSSGRQPMVDEELTVVFNGEIYNFLGLRKELEALGHKFETRSDTEVILKAYREWGPDCVERLSGMFAFALWDAAKRRLVLARDRLGKKPLYYTVKGQHLAFASEIKALLPELDKKTLDPEALDCYFSFGFVPSPKSIFYGIKKLPPAHVAVFSENGLSLKRYWEIKFSPRPYTLDDALEEFFTLFEKAVSIRLISDVPLGAFLSGGIDSPLVVAQMTRLLDRPVLTNSIGFDDEKTSELPLAREIARHLGTDHREYLVKPEAAEILPGLIYHLDEPLADSSALPTYYVCQMARQNVTVALSGDGGDESFGGYTFRYLPHLFESRLRKRIPLPLRSTFFRLLGSLYPRASWLPKPLRLKTIFQNLAVSDVRAFYQDLVWLPVDIREEIYSAQFKKELDGASPFEWIYPLYQQVKELDPMSRAQFVDLNFYLPEDVLVKVDRMSMAVALEVRSPLLDYQLVEFAGKLPLKLKVRGNTGKILLREALKKFLPEGLISKPKRGFAVPEAKWLRGELKPFLEEALAANDSFIWQYLSREKVKVLWQKHLSGRFNLGVFFWGLMILRLWEKEFFYEA
ncbi:asparagine synthase (glutamine-hydrolyzing) [Thermodesulfatator indicus DSM 15286]|uniref:asparagine synthase (glutamine-hydrolyzing) n=1 Tax=Thermodesulfatator indicus (strain DSM 15286 / JCM 11887 / CIR29812) TaxID=667014 RepID=F8AC34_THEID|nr:asparagine synthase (glutamine-hydrolyzing) [Thermodesulfatator indicus]AEH44589.1 asparagine synthase (glutamine-hydrolyzing) [Thermodesulfatator indicus DSM 15286]